MQNPAIFMDIAERFGVPVAFAIIMVLLLVWFASQHRSERGEWRDMMAMEADLTRKAIREWRDGLSQLAESVAFLDGKMGNVKKPRRK